MVRAVAGDPIAGDPCSPIAGDPIACMLVVSMHPTVLREDSRVVSGDFPGLARQFLQQ